MLSAPPLAPPPLGKAHTKSKYFGESHFGGYTRGQQHLGALEKPKKHQENRIPECTHCALVNCIEYAGNIETPLPMWPCQCQCQCQCQCHDIVMVANEIARTDQGYL